MTSISSPTNKGDVFCYHNYEFPDGSIIDKKLFVVLNDYTCDGSSICLSVITTSQEKHYPGASAGCNKQKAVFLIPKDKELFNKDTYIKMRPIYPYVLGDLIKLRIGRVIDRIGNISDQCHKDLLACLKKFKDDIATEHWQILFPR